MLTTVADIQTHVSQKNMPVTNEMVYANGKIPVKVMIKSR